jgi:PAS domain S-box-containing protein
MTNNFTTSPASGDEANNRLGSSEPFPDGRACFIELMSHVNLLAVMFNSNAEITYCNDHFIRVTGWSFNELVGRRWYDVFVPPWAGDLAVPFSHMFKNKQHAWHHDSDLLTRSGERHWVRWNSINLRDMTGTVVGAASLGENITERRNLERALLDSSARERRNLQSELHDGLGQELFGIALSARSLAVDQGKGSIAGDLRRLSKDANAAIETCRRISRGLSPLSDVEGGLVIALQRLASPPADWDGPTLDFSATQSTPLRLSSETQDHLYRLAQEGLTNALRHAEASSIKILLDIQPTTVTLEIIDDGVGMPMNVEASAGMGLKLMRYRANVLRAHFRISPGSPRGTHLLFRCEH